MAKKLVSLYNNAMNERTMPITVINQPIKMRNAKCLMLPPVVHLCRYLYAYPVEQSMFSIERLMVSNDYRMAMLVTIVGYIVRYHLTYNYIRHMRVTINVLVIGTNVVNNLIIFCAFVTFDVDVTLQLNIYKNVCLIYKY